MLPPSLKADKASRGTALLEWTAHNIPVVAALAVRGRFLARFPSSLRPCGMGVVRHLKAHGRSLQTGRSPLEDSEPWIQFDARDYVAARLRTSATILEFGSGGSTLYWLSRGCAVVSVEHDPDWSAAVFDRVQRSIGRNALVDLRVVPPQEGSSEEGGNGFPARSTNAHYANMSFRAYVEAARDLPAQSVDLLVVDGRARAACLASNVHKVRREGLIILDNSDRSEYQQAMLYLEKLGWQWRHFQGPTPYLRHFTRTSIATQSSSATNDFH